MSAMGQHLTLQLCGSADHVALEQYSILSRDLVLATAQREHGPGVLYWRGAVAERDYNKQRIAPSLESHGI